MALLEQHRRRTATTAGPGGDRLPPADGGVTWPEQPTAGPTPRIHLEPGICIFYTKGIPWFLPDHLAFVDRSGKEYGRTLCRFYKAKYASRQFSPIIDWWIFFNVPFYCKNEAFLVERVLSFFVHTFLFSFINFHLGSGEFPLLLKFKKNPLKYTCFIMHVQNTECK